MMLRAIAIGTAIPLLMVGVASAAFHGRADSTGPVPTGSSGPFAPAVVRYETARPVATRAAMDVREAARAAAAIPQVQPVPSSSTFWAADSCAVVGDSLAVGMSEQFRHEGLTCERSALEGRSSAQVLDAMPERISAAYVLLSAGVNDLESPVVGIDANLRAIRSRIDAGSVVWLLPVRQPARSAVAEVCAESGDRAVDLTGMLRADGVHPRDYAQVAKVRGDAQDCRAILARG